VLLSIIRLSPFVVTSPGTLACWMYDYYIVYINPVYEMHTVLDDLDQDDKCINKLKQNILGQYLKKGFRRT